MAKEIINEAKGHFSRLKEDGVKEQDSIHKGEQNLGTYEPTENFHKVFSKIMGERHNVHSKPNICVGNGQYLESQGDTAMSKEAIDENPARAEDNSIHIPTWSDAQEVEKGKSVSSEPQHISVFEKLSRVKKVEEAVEEKKNEIHQR